MEVAHEYSPAVPASRQHQGRPRVLYFFNVLRGSTAGLNALAAGFQPYAEVPQK